MKWLGFVDGVGKAKEGEFKQDGGDNGTNNVADLLDERGMEGAPDIVGVVKNSREDNEE